MKYEKLPQLRLIATTFCDSKCVYCRPSGESAVMAQGALDLNMALRVAKIYQNYGGTEIKITGGDPVFWESLVDCVIALKNMGLRVEVITRSIKMRDFYLHLINEGVDCINFSLDTLNVNTYKSITNKDGEDFNSIIDLIKTVSRKVHTKINMVVMRGINDCEIENIIQFCEDIRVRELKLLDVIDDLHKSKITNENRLINQYNVQLKELYSNINIEHYGKPDTEFQGGLGHPLLVYTTQRGLKIKVKNAHNGAWYSVICQNCKFYPCHDALMALRLMPENKLQICLLNENNVISLSNSDKQIDEVMQQALSIYEKAFFVGGRYD